ncbi:hypothetical protein ACS126_13095 [Sphingobacterium lactis]|uniref:hypothetical protein n=1 Tax=Sphingobacterium lactis TaxID=797291 RepID=UPI003EC644DB
MKAISKREHKALIAALQQLEDLSAAPKVTVALGNEPAGGFLQHIQSLSEQFGQYESLLAQLADCIAEYEAVYKEVRVNVVAPALRQARRQLGSKSTKTMQLGVHLAAAQGF